MDEAVIVVDTKAENDATEIAAELERVKKALVVSESEKEAILDGFPGIICLVDTQDRIVWANEQTKKIHADPVRKTCHEVFCGSDVVCDVCSIPIRKGFEPVESIIKSFEVQNGSNEEFMVELAGTPVRGQNDEVLSYLIIGWDVTDKLKLEKQLRHSQKMEAIGTLAGGIAHDFNNVLTPIMGYSEIIRLKMQQDGIEDQTIQEYLNGILRAAKRAKKLVEQVLTFSRSSEKKEALQYLHPIVKEVMKLMRVSLPSTVVIHERIDENCGMVLVDPVQIHQVLINLCTNSAEAMKGEHGSLTVSLCQEGSEGEKNYIKLSVVDTGCGIEEEKLERIFEPYFTTKEKGRGTGMGLAMVHGVINRQGGKIEVQSKVGEGTTFNLYLPVVEQATAFDQVVNTTDLIQGSGHILLVDDESQVVQVTGELLTSLGYQVTGKTSAFDALALFLKDPAEYDLLLTDLTMPELTGVELCKKIKAVRSDLPVVLITGYSEQLPREAADEAGVDQYCMKPVSMRELSAIVHNTMAKAL
jgi:two-component system, cell cycle sensor histidine kinase and response regulator CckA